MKKQIFNSTLLGILATALGFLMSFLMTPILLNRLGQNQYGVFVFLGIFSVGGYFSLLDLGMQGSAVKYIAEYYAKNNMDLLTRLINTIILFFVIAGLLGGCILFAINHLLLERFFHIPADYIYTVKLMLDFIAVSFLFQFPLMGLSSVVEGIQRFDILRIPPMVIAVISNLIIFAYLKYDLGIVFLTVVSLAGSLILFCFYLFSIKVVLPNVRINPMNFSRDMYKQLFGMSSKLFISRIVGLIFNNTDKVVISLVLTASVMTNYDIVNKINMIIVTMASLVNGSLISFTSRFSGSNDENNLKVLLVKGTKYSILLTIPALVFFCVFAGDFITSWIGGKYAGLRWIAVLFISHSFLSTIIGVGSTMLVGVNKVSNILKISIIMAFLNLTISLATVKSLGITGLILGTVVAYVIGSIIYIPLIAKTFKISVGSFIREATLKPYVLAFLTLLGLVLVKNLLVTNKMLTLFIIAVITYLFYFAIYLLWDSKERKTLFELVLRTKKI